MSYKERGKTHKRRSPKHSVTIKGIKRCPSYPKIPQMSDTILPGDNFYDYINKEWVRHAHLIPFNVSIGVSEEIEQEIDKELAQLCLKAKQHFSEKPLDKNDMHSLGCLTESVYNNRGSYHTFKTLLRSIHCIRDSDDICATLGEFMAHRIQTMLTLYSGPEETDPIHWRIHLSPGSFGLPDDSYYNGKGPGGARIFNAYLEFLRKVGADFDTVNLEPFVQFESKYASFLESTEMDLPDTYTFDALKKKYRYINWDIIYSTIFRICDIPYKHNILTKIVVDSPQWLRLINNIMKETISGTYSIELWKAIFQSNLILHCLQYIPYPYDEYYFQFFNRRLRGITDKNPRKVLAIRVAQDWLTVPLSRIYIKYYVTAKQKGEITAFANTIRNAAVNRIRATKWMMSSTAEYAIKKVRNMHMGILFPEHFSSYESPQLDCHNLLYNILALGISKTRSELVHINKFTTHKTWDDPVFSVNAYYYNQGNRLILPAGIARWPFYCKSAIAWNYGGLGSVIGHEITHAFDVDGMYYDADGKLNEWWKRADMDKYNILSDKLVQLFNRGKHYGHKVDGSLTLSENISDLGGVAIALDALKNSQQVRGVTGEAVLQEYRDFFTSYAVSWRIKERKKKAVQALFIDKHAPAPLRVNYIVAQFDEWYSAFDITQKNALYIEKDERIRIF
jgi:putative endopeptidase